jgi:TPR repeat protein
MGGEESAKTSAPREIPNSQIQTAAKVSSGSQRVEPAQGLWAQAVARHQEGDEPGALRLTRAAAQAGNSVALYQLGYLYKHGEGGLPRDLREAASWYTKSASLGNPEAEATLGLLYEEGDAVPEDWVKAAQLYQQSAEQNNAIGQSQLARAYEFGIGVHQSRQMAIQWDQRAAALGNAQSAYFARWLKTPSNSVGFRNQEERSLFPGMPDQLIHEPVGVLFHNSAERIAFLRVSAVSMTGKSK